MIERIGNADVRHALSGQDAPAPNAATQSQPPARTPTYNYPMRRWTLHITTALSLLLMLAVVGLWGMVQWALDCPAV